MGDLVTTNIELHEAFAAANLFREGSQSVVGYEQYLQRQLGQCCRQAAQVVPAETQMDRHVWQQVKCASVIYKSLGCWGTEQFKLQSLFKGSVC